MLALLRLPPLVMLVIVLALAAFVVYHITAVGRPQPLTVIALLVLGLASVRILWRMRHKSQERERD